jgi:hypothetical protein
MAYASTGSYVAKSGDTMSGALFIQMSYPYIQLNDTVGSPTKSAYIQYGVTLAGSGGSGAGYWLNYSQDKPFGWTIGSNQGVLTLDASGNLAPKGVLQMATSGTSYISMGRFPQSTTNGGEAWLGRAADRNTGSMTVQLGVNNSQYFEIVDYAWTTVTLRAGMNDFSYKGNAILHAGNYNSYSPTLTGGNASGTWGISISGSAASAGSVTGASTMNGYLVISADWSTSPYTSALTIIGTYPSITYRGSNSNWEWLHHTDASGNFHWYGGSGYTSNGWTQRMTMDTGGQLFLRTGRLNITNGDNSGTYYGPNATWGAYLYVGAASNQIAGTTAQVIATDGNLHLDSGNASKAIYMNYYSGMDIRMYGVTRFYAQSYYSGNYLSGVGNIYCDNNYGNGLIGLYSSTVFQGIFAMGDAYKLTAAGGMNNLYGLTWSHPNAGGQAGYLSSHGLIVAVNGSCYSAISDSIWARSNITANGSMYANTYYMSANTAKYVTNHGGDYTALYFGGNQNGYSGFIVDGGMHLMVHTTGTSGPCGFWYGNWSILTYVSGDQNLYSNGSLKFNTRSDGVLITGTLYATGDVIAYYSDIRLKKDVVKIDNAISKIQKLRGVTYTWNDEKVNQAKERAGKRDIGLIAQEVEAVEPLLITEYQSQLNEPSNDPEEAAHFVPQMSETYKTIKYEKLVALLVEGMKEQQEQITSQKHEIDSLKGQIALILNSTLKR